jgi:subtilisin family serine protease/uncharacterized protein YaiE (UPF0345 family)
MIRLVSILALSLFLTNCGGGGGPVSISVPNPTNISVSTDVISNSFISRLVDIADDKQIDVQEAYEAFQWVDNHPNFDPSSLSNVNIIIDGQTMTVEEGYYALKGFKTRYYDGNESFWSMAANQGQFDDDSSEYLDMMAIVEYDQTLTAQQKLDLYKNQGQGEKVIVSKTVSNSTTTSTSTSDPVNTDIVTTRTETVENDNGSTTTNVYTVTTTTAVVTTTVYTTVTPIATFTWSDGTTTEQQGEATVTSQSADSSTQSVTEVLASTSTTAHVVDTYVVNVEEQSIAQGDDVITTATTTRTESESTDDATITRTYQVVTTTTRTPTHTTTTLTPKTVTEWSDGTETYVLGTPVTETVTTWAESSTSAETLIATNSVPIGTQFLTDEYNSTALAQINASYAYDRGYTGDGVIVGIVDTGIDTDHEDFDSDRFSTINYRFAGTEDDNGHGTHVAGIIAATKNDTGTHGVAYDADLISIKLCFAGGNCSYSYFDEAMKELSMRGVTVANLSVNTTTALLTQIGETDSYYLPGQSSMDGIADATISNYQSATDNGMIIVNSAGNYGLDYPMMPSHYATRVDSYGNLYLNGQWLIVGAVDSNNNITSWSNKAGHICSNVIYTDGVATGCNDTFNTKDFYVVAPGVNIMSTANGGGTTTMSGTSMAAPYVTGAIAVLKQAWPQLEAEQLVGLITSTAQDLGEPGVDAVYGHGLVDLNEATKPQGDIVAVQPSGSISSISGGIVGDSSMSGLDNLSGISSIVVMDAFDRDYYVDDDNFTAFQLMDKPLGNQYMSYEPMETLYGDNIKFSMSHNGDDWQYAQSIEHTEKFNVMYNIGHIKQDGAVLGSAFQGSFAVDSSTTNYIGADMNYSLNQTWTWIGSYVRGYSNVQSADNSYITGSSNLQSQSWYVGMSYSQKQTDFSFKIGEQLNVIDGSLNYSLPTSYDWTTGTTQFTSGNASAKSSQVPKVVELAYSKNITKSWNFTTSSRYTFTNDDNILTANMGIEYKW